MSRNVNCPSELCCLSEKPNSLVMSKIEFDDGSRIMEESKYSKKAVVSSVDRCGLSVEAFYEIENTVRVIKVRSRSFKDIITQFMLLSGIKQVTIVIKP